MDEEKMVIVGFVLFVLVVALFVACLIVTLNGKVMLFINSYGVDSVGNIYIGYNTHILVYQNGGLVNTINLSDSISQVHDKVVLKGPVFTVTQDDKILLKTGGYLLTLDLEGNLLKYGKSTNNTSVNTRVFREVQTKNGDTYKMKYFLGRTAIIKNDTTVVYQISVLSLLVKLGWALVVVMLVAVVIIAIKYGIYRK